MSLLRAARAGETSTHPKVGPVENARPTNAYRIGADNVEKFTKYEKFL